jgi:Zn-dependent membrane protease YugP
LSDHFNPGDDTLNLSPDVYSGRSLAAVGVAAHELGHAMQKKAGYWPLALRSGLVPVANIGSNLSWILFFGGLIMHFKPLLLAGILLFSAAVLFTLITLPVEFDASRRALALLSSSAMITNEEAPWVRKVLGAAALTYVAAALMAVLQLLRLILLARSTDD